MERIHRQKQTQVRTRGAAAPLCDCGRCRWCCRPGCAAYKATLGVVGPLRAPPGQDRSPAGKAAWPNVPPPRPSLCSLGPCCRRRRPPRVPPTLRRRCRAATRARLWAACATCCTRSAWSASCWPPRASSPRPSARLMRWGGADAERRGSAVGGRSLAGRGVVAAACAANAEMPVAACAKIRCLAVFPLHLLQDGPGGSLPAAGKAGGWVPPSLRNRVGGGDAGPGEVSTGPMPAACWQVEYACARSCSCCRHDPARACCWRSGAHCCTCPPACRPCGGVMRTACASATSARYGGAPVKGREEG